jgi:hypothetical protein
MNEYNKNNFRDEDWVITEFEYRFLDVLPMNLSGVGKEEGFNGCIGAC